jgi:hypothetical protein
MVEVVFDDGAEEKFGHVAGALPVNEHANIFKAGIEGQLRDVLDIGEGHSVFENDEDAGSRARGEAEFADGFAQGEFGVMRFADGVVDGAVDTAGGGDDLVFGEDFGFVFGRGLQRCKRESREKENGEKGFRRMHGSLHLELSPELCAAMAACMAVAVQRMKKGTAPCPWRFLFRGGPEGDGVDGHGDGIDLSAGLPHEGIAFFASAGVNAGLRGFDVGDGGGGEQADGQQHRGRSGDGPGFVVLGQAEGVRVVHASAEDGARLAIAGGAGGARVVGFGLRCVGAVGAALDCGGGEDPCRWVIVGVQRKRW